MKSNNGSEEHIIGPDVDIKMKDLRTIVDERRSLGPNNIVVSTHVSISTENGHSDRCTGSSVHS